MTGFSVVPIFEKGLLHILGIFARFVEDNLSCFPLISELNFIMRASQRGGICRAFWVSSAMAACLSLASAIELPAKSIQGLGSQEFRERERAESDLLEWGRQRPDSAMTELLRQSRVADDPEVRDRCLNVLRDLVMDEYLKDGDGYIGITMQNEIANVPGQAMPCSVIRVTQVVADSAAQKADLRINDLIAGLDGKYWHEGLATTPFAEVIRLKKPKSKVALKVLRKGELIDLVVILGKRPPSLNNLFFNGERVDAEAAERADKEAYFRLWLSQRKIAE
jgi:hypothetical protein